MLVQEVFDSKKQFYLLFKIITNHMSTTINHSAIDWEILRNNLLSYLSLYPFHDPLPLVFERKMVIVAISVPSAVAAAFFFQFRWFYNKSFQNCTLFQELSKPEVFIRHLTTLIMKIRYWTRFQLISIKMTYFWFIKNLHYLEHCENQ